MPFDIPADARRITVDPRRIPRWIDGFADRHGALQTEATSESVLITGADGARAWIAVPFPPLPDPGDRAGGGPLTRLQSHLRREHVVGVLLVRRGGFGAGVFQGRTLVNSKVGTAYVQSQTKAGGWSQQRFARRRANQAQALYGEAADVAVRILVPALGTLERFVAGGDRPAVEAVLSDPRLAAVAALRREPWLNVPDPRLKVLTATPDQFLAVPIALHP